MRDANKKRRWLIIIGCVVAVIYAIAWVFTINDSSLNFYKRFKLKSSAKAYISEKYPDFKSAEISVYYDNTGKLYVADCKSSDDTITLNYDSSLDMKYDSRFYDQYTKLAEKYQADIEKRFEQALLDTGIKCDLKIHVVLNEAEKEAVVYKNEEFRNEKLECSVTCNREKGEDALDELQFAELTQKISECIYSELDKDAHISLLKIKYNDNGSTKFTISWSNNMKDMSIKELAGEIRK